MATRGLGLIGAAALALASVPTEAGNITRLSPPRLSCAGATQASIVLEVCAGATGARAGFSVQWMTAAEYAANGNSWYSSDDPRLCKASFSGRAQLSRYDLAPWQCVTVSPGDLVLDNGASSSCLGALSCGTELVFRSFAHATCTLGHSDFTPDLTCSTLACGQEEGCVRPKDYWAFFNPPGCAADPVLCASWPGTSLTLGGVSYTVEQLVAVLKTTGLGNGLVTLAQQLIAAKLNVAGGADGSTIAAAIAAADQLMQGLIVPPVGSGFLDPSVTEALAATLAGFNDGTTGPGPCSPPDPGGDR